MTDEVGELYGCSGYTGVGYWGLDGITVNTFQVGSQSHHICVWQMKFVNSVHVLVTYGRLLGAGWYQYLHLTHSRLCKTDLVGELCICTQG